MSPLGDGTCCSRRVHDELEAFPNGGPTEVPPNGSKCECSLGRAAKSQHTPRSLSLKVRAHIFWYQMQGYLLHLEHVSWRLGSGYFCVMRYRIGKGETEGRYIE